MEEYKETEKKNKKAVKIAIGVGGAGLLAFLSYKLGRKVSGLGYDLGVEMGIVKVAEYALNKCDRFGTPYVINIEDTGDKLLVMRDDMLNTYVDAAVKSKKD